MLVYRVPREPTAHRVYVWRKLKRLGALALQDAVWVLPATSRTREQLQWLAAEIAELGGEVTLWTSSLEYESDEKGLVARFRARVDESYRQILAALKGKRPDLETLSRRYQEALAQDFFRSEVGERVREALLAARGGGRP
jgi:hypothetical protein